MNNEERRTRELQIVNAIAQDLNRSLDLGDALRSTLAQAAAFLDPLARERVPHLVHVKALNLSLSPNRLGKGTRRTLRERNKPSNAPTNLP